MIYAESLRHFAQEWIKVTPPSDDREWLWNPKIQLYLVNLYPVPAGDPFSKEHPPKPFASILINGVDADIVPTDVVHRGYFEAASYSLPRRYLFDLAEGVGGKHLNRRLSFSSNDWGEMMRNSRSPDNRFLRKIATHRHQRLCMYGYPEYDVLRSRLNEMADEHRTTIHCAEDLFDCTDRIRDVSFDSPETMLIQNPVAGYVKPVPKSKEYRVINGCFVQVGDDVALSIPYEPCDDEYGKIRVPFQKYQGSKGVIMHNLQNLARGIVYAAIEIPSGTFLLQEFCPNDTVKVSDREYVRTINHVYTVAPEFQGSAKQHNVGVRLSHKIIEGLVPNVRSNKRFFGKFSQKLFCRSNLPSGYIMKPDGTVEVMLRQETSG